MDDSADSHEAFLKLLLRHEPTVRAAIERGLAWLAANQTAAGSWESNDLGLVGVGALAFLANGHMPGVGKYGDNVERALSFIVADAKPSGPANWDAVCEDARKTPPKRVRGVSRNPLQTPGPLLPRLTSRSSAGRKVRKCH